VKRWAIADMYCQGPLEGTVSVDETMLVNSPEGVNSSVSNSFSELNQSDTERRKSSC
jgi:hypothetical protein